MASPAPLPVADALSRHLMNASVSTVHKDITDDRYRDLRRPRKVRFYVNGDRYFKGKKMYITPHRYFNFNDLLNDLTGKLPNSLNLPYGVRQIFTPMDGQRITDIEDLQDGETYVCAGFEGFKGIKYGKAELEPWSLARPHRHNEADVGMDYSYGNYRYRGFANNNAFHPGRYFRANGSYPQRRWPGTFGTANRSGYLSQSESYPLKPKVITIVRNGPRPRNNVKFLLNRRSVQSFEQLISDISEAFGPKWKNNKVRTLYTTKGRQAQGVSDFFRQNDVFIACGSENLTESDMHDIVEELYPDSPYARNLSKDMDKPRKRKHLQAHSHREPEADKRDSGFGESSDGSNSNRESDHEYANYPGKGGNHDQKGRRSQQDQSRSLEYPRGLYFTSQLEKEKAQAGYEERERAKRRQQKMLESEKRALEEERRKRGLVPLKPQDDPFKRMKEREREKVEARRKKEQEKKKQELEEAKVKHAKEIEAAELAARERQAAAEREEQERLAKEREEKEKEIEQLKEEQEKAEKLNAEEKDKDKTKDKEKDKEKENEKPPGRKRQKTKIVRKSKAERQVSGDDYVLARYDLGRTLGDGNFAVVRQSKSKSSGQEFAMKVIDKPKLKGKEHMVENEIEIMKDCHHSNIVKLYEEYETVDKIYLVMELVKGGDLFDAITQSVKFGEVDSANMVKDLCNALFYLHTRTIVHRDLKPENLLVHRNKDGTISLKLADFGLAMEVKELIYTVCGTPTYVAPEILSEIGYGLEVDMWAVGVITYILLCGFPPFRSPDRNQTELFEFIKAGEYEFLSPYWDNISSGAKDLIQHLLIVEKRRRYHAIDVLIHPWILVGGDMSTPRDNVKVDEMRRERKKELEIQAKQNLDNYQKLKEKKKGMMEE